MGTLAGVERVLHEHGDGHRAHAAGDGRDGFAERGHGVEVHVADDAVAGLLGGVRHAVDADVDDDCAGLDHVGGDEAGLADRGDDDVGQPDDSGQVFGARVGDGDGAVATLGEEQGGGGLADDERAADDDGVLTGGLDPGAAEEFDDASGRASGESARDFLDEATDALRAKAVDILVGRDAVEDFSLGEVLGQRGLDEDTMDRGVGVEGVEVGEELGLGDRLGKELERGLHADLGCGLLLLGHVGDRGGIVADADEGHVGYDRGELSHALLDFGEDLLGDGVSVDEAHGG